MASQEIPLATVRRALDDAGLPPDSLGDLRTETAFQRAIKELKAGRTIDKVSTDKKTGVIVFQFTRKTLDEARLAIDFDPEANCTLDTATGDITCPGSWQIENHARTMFQHAIDHRQTSDITRLVQRLFLNNADLYAINPKKGVAYFVPERFRGFSAQMEDFLTALGGTLWRFPVPAGSPEGTRSVRDAVENGLMALSVKLQEAVDAWTESTHNGTMEHATERLRVLRHKAESYAEYLGDRQSNVLAMLDSQKKAIVAQIDRIGALKETAKTAPQADGSQQQTLFSETAPDETPAPYYHVDAGELPPDFTPGYAGEQIETDEYASA